MVRTLHPLRSRVLRANRPPLNPLPQRLATCSWTTPPEGTVSPTTDLRQNQPAGNVAYDSMGGQATGSDSLGIGERRSVRADVLFERLFWPMPGWSGPSWQADLYYPWHIVPGRSVFFGALQAAVDDYGKGYFNAVLAIANTSPNRTEFWVLWGWVDWDDTNSTGWLRF